MIGFARINGRTIGIVGNQPLEAAGNHDFSSMSTDALSPYVMLCYVIQLTPFGAFQWPITSSILRLLLT